VRTSQKGEFGANGGGAKRKDLERAGARDTARDTASENAKWQDWNRDVQHGFPKNTG
jgi:hypothetical protein